MIIRKKTLLLAVAALIVVGPVSSGWAQIYKVTDDKNGVVFTDSPNVIGNTRGHNVEEVELEQINTAAPIEMRANSESANSSTTAEPSAVAKPTVSITVPVNETTIAMGPGNFAVSATPSPALTQGEELTLMIDGVAQGGPQSSASWFIEGSLRGPHDLVVQRTDANGELVAASQPVRIYVLRPSLR